MDEPIRKRRRVYDEPGHAHYLTFSCRHRLPLLGKDRTRRWFLEAVETARQRHAFDVYAYVIMPEHAHLLVRGRTGHDGLSRFLYDLKRPVAWKAKTWLRTGGRTAWLDRLTSTRGRRNVFHFWQPGGGFDRNMTDRADLPEVMAYIHANPVRRGLAESPTDWIWSSARFWEGLDGVLISMDSLPE
ncbi:MAG: transposase [Planctomycetes bacterium]|nr:transposase [Planctomycetota bacterium]